MKRALLALIILVLALAVTGAPAAGQTVVPAAPPVSGIWVSGQGTVTVEPDLATLNLGVQAQAATVAEAQTSAATVMTAVVAQLRASGVADNDIRTVRFSIQPLTTFRDGRSAITGYQVTNLVLVKIRNIANTGQIIDAAARAGGDLIRINDIAFTVADPTPHFRQARQLAMADAAAKAGQLADLAGVTIGRPFYINESGGFTPIPQPLLQVTPALPPTPISPGEIQISLTVQAAYPIQ
ncbi:MAG: SIMPL domain-containing protein [Chloroflexi bacterium]|nr:SIMPL domain-containing protein [Chloroflexota bacterium]